MKTSDAFEVVIFAALMFGQITLAQFIQYFAFILGYRLATIFVVGVGNAFKKVKDAQRPV